MGWKRIKGHDYYYKCERVKGKVRTRYYGAGMLALLACAMDAEEAEEREAKRQAAREWREQGLERERPIIAWCDQVEHLARAVMHAAGFHLHKRYEWRRARDMAKATKPIHELTSKEVNRLCGKAQDGDQSVMPQVRAIMKAEINGTRPDCDLVDYYGSPSRWLVKALAHELVREENLASKAAIPLALERMRKALEGENPTALERLLAERVAVCSFMVNHYEVLYVQAKNVTLSQATWYQHRINCAHKRFLLACKTLDAVRRKAMPNLLVALGQNQQFNVGNGQPPPT